MKMDPISHINPSVMDIPSVVNNAKDVVTQKMDIFMILNPPEAEFKREEHSDNDSVVSKMDTHAQYEPSHYVQQRTPVSNPLVHYQTGLESLAEQNHARLSASRGGRTRLPLSPIHRRQALTFNPINGHDRYTIPCSLPPIYPPHDEGYHSTSPARQYRHQHNHEHRHRRHSQSVSNSKSRDRKRIYSTEEVDFIRYCKDDLHKHWPQVQSCFRHQFVERQRDSEQCLSSRYYRDNCLNMYDENGEPIRDENGKIKTISAKVRGRGTPAGRLEGLPYTLVQKHPERSIRYSWVSDQHKAEARQLAAEMSEKERGMYFLSSTLPSYL